MLKGHTAWCWGWGHVSCHCGTPSRRGPWPWLLYFSSVWINLEWTDNFNFRDRHTPSRNCKFPYQQIASLYLISQQEGVQCWQDTVQWQMARNPNKDPTGQYACYMSNLIYLRKAI